ncbi:Uma2 family endonuclease [Hymenobacter psychrophilus]|uniref:Endonuclease, Uma2 family (Restriction endonuclease fold) n=1 Tax=Hymenobacter psychrophilus TaxID=651662 RepID=A0A1H3E9P9_9BACT|nr:Uma2 family endonuclease [Hymenobacter psychrophilus]SDX75385.1 Endonuclease, Uma2 family (restriction endonuclease fold) [Hymenobacter psychrophilus]
MSVITDISQLDLTKTYTYADYLTWRLDEFVELIRGKVRQMSPAPRVRHQAVSFNLGGIIRNKTRGGAYQGFAAPFDVRLLKSTPDGDTRISTVVQPDLCVICDPAKLDEFGCVGAPDWIIEILSPGNVAHDSKTKFDLYEENGVGEYWMVDPGLKNVMVYVLESEQYQLRGEFYQPGPIPVATLPGTALEWAEVFEGI